MIKLSVLIFRVIITVKKTVISCYFSCWYFTDFACFSLTQNIRKIPPKKPTEFTCVQRHSFMPRLVPEQWSWIMSRTYLAEYNNVTVNLTSELLNIKVITSYFIRSDFCICTNVTVTSDHQTLISSSSSQREHFQPALKKFPQLLLRYRVHKNNSYSFIVIFQPF